MLGVGIGCRITSTRAAFARGKTPPQKKKGQPRGEIDTTILWSTQQFGIAQTVDDYAFRFIVLFSHTFFVFPSVAKGFLLPLQFIILSIESQESFSGEAPFFADFCGFFYPSLCGFRLFAVFFRTVLDKDLSFVV